MLIIIVMFLILIVLLGILAFVIKKRYTVDYSQGSEGYYVPQAVYTKTSQSIKALKRFTAKNIDKRMDGKGILLRIGL